MPCNGAVSPVKFTLSWQTGALLCLIQQPILGNTKGNLKESYLYQQIMNCKYECDISLETLFYNGLYFPFE